MTTRAFMIHGLAFAISCENADAASAIARRLGAYEVMLDERTRAADTVRITIGMDLECATPHEPGRRVYDTPIGDVLYYESDDVLMIHVGRLVTAVVDIPRRSATFAVERDCVDAWALCTHPLLTMCVLEFMKRHGAYPVHAGGAMLQRGAVVVPGTSGAGKSTLTAALLQTGAGFLSDDVVFLRSNGQNMQVLSFADELDVTDETAAMFQELDDLVGQPFPAGRPKHAVRAEERFRAPRVDCAPAVALVFPNIVGGRHSAMRIADTRELLTTLAPNVLLTETESSQRHLDALSALIDVVPAFHLDMGTDIAAAARLVVTTIN